MNSESCSIEIDSTVYVLKCSSWKFTNGKNSIVYISEINNIRFGYTVTENLNEALRFSKTEALKALDKIHKSIISDAFEVYKIN